jgi:hypothetical protein
MPWIRKNLKFGAQKGKAMANSSPDLKFFIMGPVRMIFHAILTHRREHGDNPPRRIELHPAVMMDFRAQLKKDNVKCSGEYTKGVYFMGVPVIANVNADQPRLITMEGRIEFL